MLVEIGGIEFGKKFAIEENPFLSVSFLKLNENKVDRLLFLVSNSRGESKMGIAVGLKDGQLLSPFSAPFGGFHFKKSNILIEEIDIFLDELKIYIKENHLIGFRIILPPNLYNVSLNAKMVNSLTRNNFKIQIPDLINFIALQDFTGQFPDRNARTNLNKAIKNELNFKPLESMVEKRQAYDIIKENRERLDRKINMSFEDLNRITSIWPVDFFLVFDQNGTPIAAAIFYRAHPKVIYAVFWGDSEKGRELKAMDFLSYSLFQFYKKLNYKFIDLGTSSEKGIPNSGLLRFKERHGCFTDLRHSFVWISGTCENN